MKSEKISVKWRTSDQFLVTKVVATGKYVVGDLQKNHNTSGFTSQKASLDGPNTMKFKETNEIRTKKQANTKNYVNQDIQGRPTIRNSNPMSEANPEHGVDNIPGFKAIVKEN